MRFSVRLSVCVFTTPRSFAGAFFSFFLYSKCAASVSVNRQINRPFPAIRRCFYRGKDKSPLVSVVGNCCRCTWLNVTPNSRAINYTELPLKPFLPRVSSSREPEWCFLPLLGQSESDSLIELMFADGDTSTNGAATRMWRSCYVKPSHKERAIGAVRCNKEGMLLQHLRWRCIKCVIHHERDVREE